MIEQNFYADGAGSLSSSGHGYVPTSSRYNGALQSQFEGYGVGSGAFYEWLDWDFLQRGLDWDSPWDGLPYDYCLYCIEDEDEEIYTLDTYYAEADSYDNAAGGLFLLGLSITQWDSPLFGPGDAVGSLIMSAALTWMTWNASVELLDRVGNLLAKKKDIQQIRALCKKIQYR